MNLIGKSFIMKTKEKGICIKNDDYIVLDMENGKIKKFESNAIDKGFLVFEDPDLQEEYALGKEGNKIYAFLNENYGFEGLFHETHLQNLKSILETGFLFSRKTLVNDGIKFYDCANQDVLSTLDSKKIDNYCRLYFQYANIWL